MKNRIPEYLLREAMARKKQAEKTQLGTYIPVDLHQAVREYSEESGIPIARIVEDALRMLLKKRFGDDRPGRLDRWKGEEEEDE